MTDDKNQPEGAPEEGAPLGGEPTGDEPRGDENWIQAEGPDVETSLNDADQAFLNGEGDLPSGPGPDGTPQDSEHLADLRRVTAEYANYRRRTERERDALRDRATGKRARSIWSWTWIPRRPRSCSTTTASLPTRPASPQPVKTCIAFPAAPARAPSCTACWSGSARKASPPSRRRPSGWTT